MTMLININVINGMVFCNVHIVAGAFFQQSIYWYILSVLKIRKHVNVQCEIEIIELHNI